MDVVPSLIHSHACVFSTLPHWSTFIHMLKVHNFFLQTATQSVLSNLTSVPTHKKFLFGWFYCVNTDSEKHRVHTIKASMPYVHVKTELSITQLSWFFAKFFTKFNPGFALQVKVSVLIWFYIDLLLQYYTCRYSVKHIFLIIPPTILFFSLLIN